MRYRPLGKTDMRVSAVGFGASPLGNVFGSISESESQRAVHAAIDGGINLFDVSPYYGHTLAEKRLGAALCGRRQSIYLATKCGRYDLDGFDFSGQRIRTSIDESLRRLQTDYVDLLQAHDIEFGHLQQIVEETIPAMQEIQSQGKARFIGITSYQLGMLAKIAKANPLDTVLSYCRFNLLVDDMDLVLTPVLKDRNIGLLNASPLHMGIITRSGAPAWHPAPENAKRAGAQIVQLCEENGFNPAQVALRFCIDHPYVASTLVGMSATQQVEENLRAVTMDIDPTFMAKIEALVAPVKNTIWQSGLPENADG